MRKILNISISAFLCACSTTPITSVRNIPQIEDKDFQYYIDADVQAKSRLDSPKRAQREDNWEETQQKNCRIFAASEFRKQDPTVKFYWDGECKDGYAYGLGREFSIGKNTYIESIGLYTGGRVMPEYYYDYFEKNKTITFHGQSNYNQSQYMDFKNVLFFKIMLVENNMLVNTMELHDIENKNFYRVTKFPDVGHITYDYISGGGLSISNWKLNDSLVDSFSSIGFGSDKISIFEWVKYKNQTGELYDTRVVPKKLVRPPNNLINLVDEKLSYLDKKLKNHDDAQVKFLNLSFKMVDIYTQKTCASGNYLKEVGKQNYFEICSPYKSLNRLSNQIEQGLAYGNQLKKQRLVQVEQFAVQDRINAERFQQQKASSKASFGDVMNAISQVANTMADGYTQRANMYSNMSNSFSQMPSMNIQPIRPQRQSYSIVGNSIYGSDGSSCTKISNIVQCR
ncbi:hypothetical protein MKI79_02410 [Acinetobacter sp. A3.8]|uniref:Lipoprotein n=1 Tax=Acinetobacter sedimenti TaxID=2919922 RepID=A0A9X1WXP6_9GAMM|nr:hypothetical protein [Acinetobacter sedimenti]MCJ8145772.1 hypothetical protein [Acinetobacter sedimenti]